jgi:hypothetical protein
MEVVELSADEWFQYAADAHLSVFNEIRPPDMNRIDFALMVVDNDVPQTFATCRELDSETVYLQYGGSFPETIGTVKSFRCYEMTLLDLSKIYRRCSTLIENKNKAMLKFAMKVGFEIIGLRVFENKIYLEHFIDFGGHNA